MLPLAPTLLALVAGESALLGSFQASATLKSPGGWPPPDAKEEEGVSRGSSFPNTTQSPNEPEQALRHHPLLPAAANWLLPPVSARSPVGEGKKRLARKCVPIALPFYPTYTCSENPLYLTVSSISPGPLARTSHID